MTSETYRKAKAAALDFALACLLLTVGALIGACRMRHEISARPVYVCATATAGSATYPLSFAVYGSEPFGTYASVPTDFLFHIQRLPCEYGDVSDGANGED